MHVAEGDRAGSHMCFVLEKKNHSTEAEEKKTKLSTKRRYRCGSSIVFFHEDPR